MEHLARRSSPPKPIPSIRGGTGSFASTLDHALDRNTPWTRDIFGSDKEGTSLLKRFVIRINARRRRHQEVEITLRPEARKRLFIEVRSADSREISDAEVREIIKKLDPTNSWGDDSQIATKTPEPPVTTQSSNESARDDKSALLGSIYQNIQVSSDAQSNESPSSSDAVNSFKFGFKKEALEVISRPEALNSLLGIDEVRRAVGHVRFKHTVGARNQTEIGQLLCSGELNSQHFADQTPAHCRTVVDGLGLKFALSPMLIGSVTIFNYLRCIRRIQV